MFSWYIFTSTKHGFTLILRRDCTLWDRHVVQHLNTFKVPYSVGNRDQNQLSTKGTPFLWLYNPWRHCPLHFFPPPTLATSLSGFQVDFGTLCKETKLFQIIERIIFALVVTFLLSIKYKRRKKTQYQTISACAFWLQFFSSLGCYGCYH